MLSLANKNDLYFTEIHIPHKRHNLFEPIRVLVDTGAVLTVIDPSITYYFGYSAREAVSLSKLNGAAGRSEGYSIIVRQIKCLGQKINNFEIACHDIKSHTGISGLLGINFLDISKLR
ncbi:MAG: retropepsin-like aspartic protease [Pseudomonadota bacterium]